MNAGADDGSSEAAKWIRYARVSVYAVYVFMSVCGLTGLSLVLSSVPAGLILRGVAGILLIMGGLILGLLALAAVRFGAVLIARTGRVDQLAFRVDALESALESQGGRFDLAGMPGGDPDQLVAANVRPDGYLRLVHPEGQDGSQGTAEVSTAGAVRRLREEREWQSAYEDGDITGCRRSLPLLRAALSAERITSLEESLRSLSRAKAMQLRGEFAELVRSEKYAAALATGEQLAALFPESSLAREFETLRPRLLGRAEQQIESRPGTPAEDSRIQRSLSKVLDGRT